MRMLFVLFGLCGGLAAYVYWPHDITEDALEAQLSGGQCRFAYRDMCEQRGLEPLGRLLTEQHECDLWAVDCLSEFDTPRAQEIMLTVLRTKTDIETCDGDLPIRTSAVEYLGHYGGDEAMKALEEHLESNPSARLSRGASGCKPRPEDVQTILEAIAAIKSR